MDEYKISFIIIRHLSVLSLVNELSQSDNLHNCPFWPPSGRPLSLLILGKPGVGKTTLLRDLARALSLSPEQGGFGRNVIIVDSSNEIAGVTMISQCGSLNV